MFQYHFMQNAYLAGTCIAIAAAAAGFFVVLRAQTFAGHSLANVGFAGAAGASLIGVSPFVGLFAAGLLAALGMQAFGRGLRQTARSDVAIGAVFTAALALGYLFIHLSTAEYAGNIYSVLFGNALGIDDQGVVLAAGGMLVLLAILAWIGRPLFFASIDPEVAAARGVPVQALSFVFLIALALVVAVAVQVVGILLIFALLVTPAATARQLATRPLPAIAIAMGIALLVVWGGLAAGYYSPWPVSFFITSFAFGSYVLVAVGRRLGSRAASHV